jgi:hypothetical protein
MIAIIKGTRMDIPIVKGGILPIHLLCHYILDIIPKEVIPHEDIIRGCPWTMGKMGSAGILY